MSEKTNKTQGAAKPATPATTATHAAPAAVAAGAGADNVVVLKDALGRELKIKPLDVLYESRLARMIGAEAATNQAYMMGFVLPAASVFEIDGVAHPPPVTQKELDDAITRLGREGIAAVMQRMQMEMEQLKELIEKNAGAQAPA